jgi:ribosomal protein L31
VKCACGAEYEIPATKKEILVEICRKCSPIFTGKEETKVVMGQVEKFLKRAGKKK